MNEWISLKDKLPQTYKTVKIQHRSLGEREACLTEDIDDTLHWFIWDWGHAPLWRVTHWQPIPEPPIDNT